MLALRAVGLRPALRVSKASAVAFRTTHRQIKTDSLTPVDARTILDKQRLNRPLSPELTIYQPQITWILSIMHRFTGAGLSVGMYAFFLSYLAAPVVGVPLDSAHIIDFIHQLPEWAKLSGKTILSAPFVFHTLNGMRHLQWDVVKGMNNAAVKRSGYAVLAGTVLGTAALVMI
ncbi:hypothetical protein M408DRAFT_330656 [Serendipita vermifera MAFF 305830]|uniref:Succinate dehydrogenase cytochrome b560 subunit n=1 Tax=Serendipita vermifera MAFF 305830 TaxID=933852 RepID=A0A0C2WIR2_SERVB|nr:hypothetical protein M408DRAFT_330656 [Serendipita vermifera MAFF 305830]